MKIIPLNLREANEFVKKYHRHSKPAQGCKFCIGCEKDGKLVGVAIAGRPVARYLDDKKTIEITRVCTDGTKNASSFLYSRCKRISQLLGYEKIITYTLKKECGSSLKAIGAKVEVETYPHSWNCKSRKRKDYDIYTKPKLRWEL